MKLLWVEVTDFRNHRETKLSVPEGTIALVGANAQGKTNLLEAVHYLLTLESPRVGSDQPLVRSGAERAYLRGEVHTRTGRVLVEVEVRSSGANRVRVNGSAVRRKRDLRGRVRSAMFIPEDLSIVHGEPDERRRFLDEASQALWPATETQRRSYERTLRQRNRLLKEHEGGGAPAELEAWDAELVAHGTALTRARGEAIDRVAPPASDAYREVAGTPLLVRYLPSVEGADVEQKFRRRLEERRGDELLRRRTLVGPHRDDLELAVGDLSARRFSSHGEGWAAALCLRLGLARALAAEAGETPILLLDDPFSGLDPLRRMRLGEQVLDGGQVLVSVPDEAQVPEGATVFEVEDGEVRAR